MYQNRRGGRATISSVAERELSGQSNEERLSNHCSAGMPIGKCYSTNCTNLQPWSVSATPNSKRVLVVTVTAVFPRVGAEGSENGGKAGGGTSGKGCPTWEVETGASRRSCPNGSLSRQCGGAATSVLACRHGAMPLPRSWRRSSVWTGRGAECPARRRCSQRRVAWWCSSYTTVAFCAGVRNATPARSARISK